jgi:hypothetical protein
MQQTFQNHPQGLRCIRVGLQLMGQVAPDADAADATARVVVCTAMPFIWPAAWVDSIEVGGILYSQHMSCHALVKASCNV